MKKLLAGAFSAATVLAGVAFGAGSASASTINNDITATVSGTSTTSPTNGILYIYDNATSEHHTRTVEYYQHDGYSKTENLVGPGRPLGVVLKEEDIENACLSSKTDGSENPVGGYDIQCVGHLVSSQPAPFPLGGDLIGRFCRVPQSPYKLHCPADPPIHVNEDATGNGDYLQVGNKDHGAMEEIDYYTNVAGQDVDVNVKLPIQVLVTRVILLPATGAPSAVLVLH